ncbi:MAG: aldo/keto reductase [Bacteroidales bacterium]|nr:aldo/keto reductase [Bacteroidales bacterium]
MTTRRHFIRIAAGTAGSIILPVNKLFGFTGELERDKWGTLLPRNYLGKTGEKVTMLGLGGFHVGRMDDAMAQKTIETAIAGGIRYFDTAESYQDGVSEEKYGKFLSPVYRDEVFIMTKTRATDRKTAENDLHASLKRLNTDVIDLWMMHAINSVEDVDKRINSGVLNVMLRAKQEGKIKHLGFSGHTTIKAHRHIMNITDEPEACMLPVNAVDPGHESFIENIVPELHEKNMGVIAMKTLAGGAFFGRGFDGRLDAEDKVMDHITVEEAIQFSLSIPNHVLVTGPKTPEMLQEKIDIAKSFRKLTEEELKNIFAKVKHLTGKDVEYYKGRP